LLDLELDAPPGCPAPAMVERAIERLVQNPPAAPLHVSAHLVPLPDRWQLRASFESGTRMVDGDTCTAVAEALVVMVALAIDPTGKLDESVLHDLGSEPAPPPGATASPASSAAPATVQSAQPASSSLAAPASLPATEQQTKATPPSAPWASATRNGFSLRGEVRVQGNVAGPPPRDPARIGASVSLITANGLLPDWSLGPSAGVHFGQRREWFELSATGLSPRFASVGNGSATGGNISWFGAQAGGCALPFANLPLGGCLAAELGDLLGRGERVQHSRMAHAFIPAASAGLVWRSHMRGDFSLDARFGFAVLGIRPKLGLQGYGLVFQPDPVSWRAAIGFSWR
jgi:hypothetical protein